MRENVYDFDIVSAGKPDPEVYPETISPSWLDLEKMKSLYPHNQNFIKNIDKLWLEFNLVGWKKSRGDGNCYYRAVISSYFLKICKPYETVDQLYVFYQKLQQLNIAQIDSQYYSSIQSVLITLNQLIEMKNQGMNVEVLKKAFELTQDKTFDLHLVRAARVFTYNEAMKVQNVEPYSFMEPDYFRKLIKMILTMNEEAEELILIFLPNGLGVQVIQFMFLDQERYSVQKFPEENKEEFFVIFIVRRHGHYDLLMTVYEMEMDQVNLNDGTYRYLKEDRFYQEISLKIKSWKCPSN